MKIPVPLRFGLALGLMHFFAVGMPLITGSANKEGGIYILVLDLPLFLLAERYARNQIPDFWLIVVGGTLMYAVLGCLLGYIIQALTRAFTLR